jgi:hypothetical protein
MPASGAHCDGERDEGRERLRSLRVSVVGVALAVALVLERVQSL